MTAKGILIGLGNPIMSDDGIGLLVSEEVHKRLPGYDLDLSCSGGFRVVDRILGRKSAVIIDSMVTGKFEPGTVVQVERGSGLATMRTGHSHGMNFLEAIEIAESCDAPLPGRILVYGIEVEDPFSLGNTISTKVMSKLDDIVGHIRHEVETLEEQGECTS
jgi:hydrogenase maturation protease